MPSSGSNEQTSNTAGATRSSDSAGITTARRSARLGSKSPHQQRTSSVTNRTQIHRTISGGVTHDRSPKNPRRRTLTNNNTPVSQSRITFQTTTPANVNQGSMADHQEIVYDDVHLSDASDDEGAITTSSVVSKTLSTGILSRAEVLSYFWIKSDGYQCRLCSEVRS